MQCSNAVEHVGCECNARTHAGASEAFAAGFPVAKTIWRNEMKC